MRKRLTDEERKRRRRDYWYKYRSRPEVQARITAYRQSPEYKARRRENQKRYWADPEKRAIILERQKRYQTKRYAEDAGFRKRISDTCKSWREKNHAYDILRKTIAAINECGNAEKLERKKETHRKRVKGLSKRRYKAYRKRNSKLSCAWAKRQRADKELGDLYRQCKRHLSSRYTAKMKSEALAKYTAIMARRKEERRRKRIDMLLEGCTEEQKARIRGGQDMRRGRRA